MIHKFQKIFLLILICVSAQNVILSHAQSDDWTVKLRFNSAQYKQNIIVGLSPEASAEFDINNDLVAYPEPPIGIYAFMEYPDYPSAFVRLTKSILSSQYPQSWVIKIKTSTNGPISVSWKQDISELLPENVVLTLKKDEQEVNMKTDFSLEWNAESHVFYTLSILALDLSDSDSGSIVPSTPGLENQTQPQELVNETQVYLLLSPLEKLEKLVEENNQNATILFSNFNSSTKIALVNVAIVQNETQVISDIMLSSNEDIVGNLLLDLEPEQSLLMIEIMSRSNITKSAKRVEAAIKEGIKQTSSDNIATLGTALGDMPLESLVRLFVTISQLPHTPSTIATILPYLSTEKTLDIIEYWIENEPISDLALVFSFMDYVQTGSIFYSLKLRDQIALLPTLSLSVLSNLPSISTINIIDLEVFPPQVLPNEPVQIAGRIINEATENQTFLSKLYVNGILESFQLLTLFPNQNITVNYTLVNDVAGIYTINLGDQNSTFEILFPSESAKFIVSQLTLDKYLIEPDDPVTVSVTISNHGDINGTYFLALMKDGRRITYDNINLMPGENIIWSYNTTADRTGNHTISVGDLSTLFEVKGPLDIFPWRQFLLVSAIMMISLSVYYLNNRKTGVQTFSPI